MSHFYSEIQGNRGWATRCGTAKSGMRGHIRGWNVGIRVSGYVDEDGEDTFTVYLTGGSNYSRINKFIGEFKEKDLI